uniref:Uncharacterized protein n=1 Tax=Arundo donax TaxID=35708 RepID=A0A0A9DCY3_ARUDO
MAAPLRHLPHTPRRCRCSCSLHHRRRSPRVAPALPRPSAAGRTSRHGSLSRRGPATRHHPGRHTPLPLAARHGRAPRELVCAPRRSMAAARAPAPWLPAPCSLAAAEPRRTALRHRRCAPLPPHRASLLQPLELGRGEPVEVGGSCGSSLGEGSEQRETMVDAGGDGHGGAGGRQRTLKRRETGKRRRRGGMNRSVQFLGTSSLRI